MGPRRPPEAEPVSSRSAAQRVKLVHGTSGNRSRSPGRGIRARLRPIHASDDAIVSGC
jgi:hypothetical protein